MFTVLPLGKDLVVKLKIFGLEKKFLKQIDMLALNHRYPSLNLELLEPKNRGIYSIRIDQKYRALLKFLPDRETIEIIAITNHYK